MDQSSDEDDGCSGSRPVCSSPDEDGERPLKKARYRWQIKGKHHLKNKSLTKSKSESSEDVSMEMDICVTTSETTETNVPQSSNYGESQSTDVEQGTSSNVSNNFGSSSSESTSRVPPDLSPCLNKPEIRTGYLLRYWQTKQVARSMLDNTLNSMMERMGVVPVYDDSLHFEDEAVLMAIHRHGLQCHEEGWNSQQDLDNVANVTEENVCKDLSRLLFSGPNVVSPEQISVDNIDDISSSEGSSSQLVQAPPTPDVTVVDMQQPSALSQLEHDSFLDAAVAVAIEKKGLSLLTGTAESG